jgi:hypothetical protein
MNTPATQGMRYRIGCRLLEFRVGRTRASPAAHRTIAAPGIALHGAKTRAVEYPEENALNIYTDGSMLSGPRRGGAAILFVLVDDQGNEEQREEVLTGYAGATQNQMELEAPIQALKMVTGRHPPFEPSRYRKIVIKTDSHACGRELRNSGSVLVS